jgi:hypothetical protein
MHEFPIRFYGHMHGESVGSQRSGYDNKLFFALG